LKHALEPTAEPPFTLPPTRHACRRRLVDENIWLFTKEIIQYIGITGGLGKDECGHSESGTFLSDLRKRLPPRFKDICSFTFE
jgi:hypothetical protein